MDVAKLILVDDHTVAREALARALQQEDGFQVVGSWPDAERALAHLASVGPAAPFDLAVVDYRLPGMDGISATRRFRELYPSVRVIILSGYCREEQILEAFEAGAMAFLPKEVSMVELLTALRAVLQGQTVLSPRITRQILEFCTHRKPTEEAARSLLSDSHMEILRLAGCGYANREISERLGLPVDTVKLRLKEAFSRLGARDRTHAVITAIKMGLFELGDCD